MVDGIEGAEGVHFEIHPSVVYKLGEDLITDAVQALAELVKNSYDADADYAIVRINTVDPSPLRPTSTGYIQIEDNGTGMDPVSLRTGFLTISNSQKREMKARGQTTKGERTPLGDKGLGRLGAQRLGDLLHISTTPTGSDVSYELSFDWRDFAHYDTLSAVPVTIGAIPALRGQGTVVTISELRDVEQLTSDSGRDLQVELSKVVSPFGGADRFELLASVNGVSLDLADFDKRVREGAQVRYRLKFDGKLLVISGDMRLSHVRPTTKAAVPEYEQLIEADNGAGLLAFIQRDLRAQSWGIKASKAKGWWLSFRTSIDLSVRPGAALDAFDVVASPGPFSGEVDGFTLTNYAFRQTSVFDTLSDYRSYIKDLNGIRVYRDGFNIRVADDWLGLGKQWTSGGSWYGLRPQTTLGFLALSARDNQQLIETTDREGFKHTPHFDNFTKLLQDFLSFTSEIQELVGRGASDFRKSAGLPKDGKSPEELMERLAGTFRTAEGFKKPLATLKVDLAATSYQAQEIVDELADAELTADEERMLAALTSLATHASSAGALVDDLDAFVRDLSEQRATGDRLRNEMDALEEQLGLAYETVAVGLTAEALSHEIANIAERLARRTTEVARYVSHMDPPSRKLNTFVEQVRSSIAGLRRQLAHLAPSLRYVRERREIMSVCGVAGETADYFEARWVGQAMSLTVHCTADFDVFMNRGKMLQILDNLVLNSEYWLREDVRLKQIEAGEVLLEIDGPVIRVSDNGRGIERSVESTLFEPFVSRKPKGEGRGLGLFIVRQLLEAEGSDIALLARRNAKGRRYMFEINLEGALHGGE